MRYLTSTDEILKIISKQWCSLDDLRNLTGLGKNSLLKLKLEIKKSLNNNSIPNKLLPMNEVVKYLNIDVDYLIKLERKENQNVDNK